MKEKRIAGLDIGTSGLKVTLADLDGKIRENLKSEYRYKEQITGVVPAKFYEDQVRGILASVAKQFDLAAISVTTQMYSICRWVGKELYICQWNSIVPRSPEQEKNFGGELLRSGCPVDTLYGGYKLFAAPADHRREFLPYGLKEHLISMLTGELATDYTTASASGLFDLKQMDWNRAYLQQMGCDLNALPRVVEHNQPVGSVRPGAFPGASAQTVVVPGLGDGPSASYACRDVSTFCGNVGTSMACRVFTDRPDLSKTSSMWIYAVSKQPANYIAGGISSNGCTAFHWSEDLGFERIDALCNTGDLLFLPWLYGERMPYWSSDLRGTILGLQADTTREQISCAVQKAVAFTLATMVQQLEPYKKAGDLLVLAGGGTNSKAVLSTVAGCIDSDIAILDNADYLCSTGSVISAGEGMGIKVDPRNTVSKLVHADGSFREEFSRWSEAGRKMAEFYSKAGV